MTKLLEVNHLSITIGTAKGEVQAVRDVSFSLSAGETLAIVGESGCGKSVMCKGIARLLPSSARIRSGSISIKGEEITQYGEKDMRRLRGKRFSMIFQDPMTSLNPTMTIGAQIGEAVKVQEPWISRGKLEERVIELMELVGIENPRERRRMYPCHLSGGMRQRSVIAIALAGNPELLIGDEPTTALDVRIQAQILELFREIQKKRNTGLILVTHDMGVVARAADRVAVMYAGKIVETGTVEEIFYDPRHPYTQGLLQSLPWFSRGKDTLYAIPGMPPTLIDPPKGDAFACRNVQALQIDYEEEPPMFPVTDTHFAATWLLDKRAPKIPAVFSGEEGGKRKKIQGDILLNVEHLTCFFPLTKKTLVRAVEDVSFQIRRGEIFGLVGESGCGKSTLARCIMNICKPQGGKITMNGVDVWDPKAYARNRKMLQGERQLIFQDSDSSLNPHMKVWDIITEPMKIQGMTSPRGSLRAEAAFQMHYVGLDPAYLEQYPTELSGGQRQRVAIARALVTEPELLVADEPLASLDVSIQAQIVNLFRHLQQEHGFSFLFIAHDLTMVAFLCDRVGVMHQGRLVEVASTEELFSNPRHPYTKALLAAAAVPDPR